MNEVILEFLFGSGKYQQAIEPLTIAAISAGASFLPKIFGGGAARRAKDAAKAQDDKINRLLANRQAVINPYENVQDLSSTITNPFANLQVATGAAQMQAEQADMSLAASLDTMRGLGMAAGGATALAQAAAASKQGIAVDIQKQEVANAMAAAKGEQFMQTTQLAEKQRVQEADVFGKTFMFQAQEQRDIADLSRASALQQQYLQQEADIRGGQNSAQASILGAGIGALG